MEMHKDHILKIAPIYYNEILSGNKTFEIRNNDRGFHTGDYLTLEEYDADNSDYTGRGLSARVGYVCDYEQNPGYVVFSILNVRIK